MPNSIADIGDVDMTAPTCRRRPAACGVLRLTPPVAGRWGESQSVHGYPIPNPNAAAVSTWSCRRSTTASAPATRWTSPTCINGIPRDAADDNYNSFDPYPPVTVGSRLGEVGDLDFLDPAGAFLLPVERMRRYVTPADINGTGRIVQWDGVNTSSRPRCRRPTSGDVSSTPATSGRPACRARSRHPAGGATPASRHLPLDEYRSLSDHHGHERASRHPLPHPLSNSNPLHGFEAQRFPNLNYTPAHVSTRSTPAACRST